MKYFATKISDNMHETPEGFLLCIGVPIGRTGEMEYAGSETPLEPGPDNIVMISRSEDEVFRPETIASFEGKPFTINHPEDFVSPDNWQQLAKGTIQHVRRGEGDLSDSLIADILIMDAYAISLVKNGMRGLSCGYEAEYVQTGEGQGLQKNIVGNHLALVDEGRAGDTYAINDKKGVFRMNKKLADTLKSIFGKTIDEAMKDESADPKEKEGAKDADTENVTSYDELVKICKDLGEKIDAMKPKAADAEEKPVEKKEGEDEEVAASLEDRVKALEAGLKQILEKMSESSDEDMDEESEDEEMGEEESEDEASPELVGDTASRAEILAPGIKASAKDIKLKALKAAYATKDGKKVIDALSAGKPAFDNAEKVDTLFVAASEVLKASRGNELSRTKQTRDFSSAVFDQEGFMTPEKMNELNEKRYNLK